VLGSELFSLLFHILASFVNKMLEHIDEQYLNNLWIKLISFSISLPQLFFSLNQNEDSINDIFFKRFNYFSLPWLIEVINQNSQEIKAKLHLIEKERDLVVVFNRDIL
jgi:hypothetical protein